MSKTLTIKSLALALLLAFGWQSAQAQAFWTEDFSDQGLSTANWVNGGVNGGPIGWVWTDVVNAGNWQPGNFGSPSAGTGYMWFDSDGNGNFQHDVTLTGVGNPANCTGKSDVHFRFYTLYRVFTPLQKGQIGVSTDGTNFTYFDVAQFDVLQPDERYEGWIDLDVDMADGKPQVWVQFRWIGEFEYYWKVDDLEMYEYTTPAGDVTFKVNMSLQTVSPSGVFFNSGGADEAMTNEGSGVWSITKPVLQGEQIQYKFKNGTTAEVVDAACGVSDGAGGFVRSYTGTGLDADVPAICFSLCTPCVVPCDQNPNAIICDNFDSYSTTLPTSLQASWWTTWSGAQGTPEDGIVSTERANTAPNSMKIFAAAAGGGPQDVVLNLGNKTSGNYDLKWKMFVPTANAAYYNIQNVVPIAGGSWNLDVFFDADGTGNIQIGAGASLAEFTYPKNSWFTVEHKLDLDNNLLSFYVNGTLVKKMAYPNNLGGIDFFGIDNTHLFYVDDVEYVQLPPVVYNVDFCSAAVDITLLFGQAVSVPQTSGLYDNTNATVSPTDPPAPSCFLDVANGATSPKINGSMWFTFAGDGNQYDIQTVPCNAGANYIDDGDTQMAIYTGDDCTDLTQILCNDDIFPSGTPDYRAGLDIQTTAGQNYYVLVDGWSLNNTPATGQFCLQVTQKASVPCSAGQVGTFAINNNGFVCFNGNLNTLLQPNNASFVIPNEGPVSGMLWCITSQPVPPNTWPGSIAGIASTVANQDIIIVSLPNTGAGFPAGQYYLTPVVFGGATLVNPANPARVFNINPAGGCFFIGQSIPFVLLPQLEDLFALAQTTNETVPPGNNGSITLAVEGGIAAALGDPSLYTFNWTGPNGFTSGNQNLTNVKAGSYTVVISDPTGCVSNFTLVITVGLVSGTTDPASVKSLSLSPNPADNATLLQLSLDQAQEVRVELVNALGQVAETINAGTVQSLNQPLNVARLAAGTYMLRVMIGNEIAVRRVVIQR